MLRLAERLGPSQPEIDPLIAPAPYIWPWYKIYVDFLGLAPYCKRLLCQGQRI